MTQLKLIGGVILAGALVVLMALFGAFYTVDEGSRAVVKRYGEVVDVTGPGLHFKTPFITDVDTVSVQSFVRRYGSEGTMEAYSSDMQVGTLLVSANFTPVSAPDAIRKIVVDYGSLDGYLTREVDPKVLQVVKATFAKFTAQSSNENQMALSAAILEALQKVVPPTLVTIQTVQIEDISFSDKFEKAMEARKMAEAQVEIQIQSNKQQDEVNKRTVNDAKAAADAAKAQADADAYKIQQDSIAHSDAIKRRGEAEAEAIRAKAKALADNPSLIELTKAERWDGVLPTTMLPDSSTPMLNLR